MKKRLAIWMGALLCAATAMADTFYVSTNGAAVVPYDSWAKAATNIQDAVDAATNAGDTVWVTNGTYYITSQIVVTNAVTVESVNGSGVTIVDGQNTNRCFNLGNSACTISGFTIQNGYVGGDGSGGGVYCADTNSVITNSTLSGNSAGSGGGSFYGTLTHCTLTGNSADFGGGSYFSTLNNCTLSGNSAEFGGGSYWSKLTHCTLTGNSAHYDGGGSFSGTLTHCTLSGNSAGRQGGGSRDDTLINCIVWNNTAPNGTNWYDSGYLNMSWSCTTPDPDAAGNNITNAPLFADAAGRLLPNSPCIDAGIAVAGITKDIDGNPIPIDGDFNETASPDMGAYEYNPAITDSDSDGRMDDFEHMHGLDLLYDESAAISYGETVGEENVTNNPASFGLYTSNSITDLDMGYMMIQTSNGWMRMSLQLEQCTNLTEGAWEPAGDAKLWELPATNGKSFFRVRGRE